MKQAYLSLFLILLLSSCGHLREPTNSARTPDSFFSCSDYLRKIWEEKLSFTSQDKLLRTFHDEAIEISEDYYNKGIIHGQGLNPLERRVYELNLEEMRGVQRGEGVPYASHPIKLSMLARNLLGKSHSKEAEQTYLYTLIHDVLEEGQGTGLQSFTHLKNKFSKHPHLADAAYILVEPDIREVPIPEQMNYSMIEVVGYARQIGLFGDLKQDKALFNSSLIDKLFNLFDRYKAVTDGVVHEEHFLFQMQWRLAKQGYLLEKMKDYADPEIVRYAKFLHKNIQKKLGISEAEVRSKIQEYKNIEKLYATQIDAIIKREARLRGLL